MIFIHVEPSTPGGAVVAGLVEPKRIDVMTQVLQANVPLYGALRQTIVMTELVPWLYIGVLTGSVPQGLRKLFKVEDRESDGPG